MGSDAHVVHDEAGRRFVISLEEQEAVLEYRFNYGITNEILPIDYHSAYWRKSR